MRRLGPTGLVPHLGPSSLRRHSGPTRCSLTKRLTLKGEVLAHCGLSSTRAASDQLTPTEIVERITLNKFLRALPGEERKAVGIKAARMPRDMITALKCTISMLEIGKGQRQLRDHNFHRDFAATPVQPAEC